MTLKSYKNICAWCGEEYDIRYYFNGRVTGYRKVYCSDNCQKQGKRLKEYQRKKALMKSNANKAKGQPGRKRNSAAYTGLGYRFGPIDGMDCWGCPMIGWDCRNEEYQPCRTFSPQHKDYIKAKQTALMMYGEG